MELDSQTVHAVCEGVQAPHDKVETLCQGAHVVDALSKDRVVSYTGPGPHIVLHY